MTFRLKVFLSDFTPVLFDIRAGKTFSGKLLGIQMPSTAPCASDHKLLLSK